MTAVLDRQFAAVERTLVAAEDTEGQPFGVRVQRFLIAAGSKLGRIGAAQLATGRGDAMLRQYVEQRVDGWSTGGSTSCSGTDTVGDCCRRRLSC
ncbi:hypothetical protein [Streptomyces brasiliensis]|uniref:Uncharacterized protein n=1 Tax=Streptomyces brasiliensis TaxID=1954 RepID=A0A917PBA8_9ACTN|nr:hypothetical protein [Streptomyces brasiliensis]GGJ69418.1 hypothetical protein GCM10010121_095160 [Streptomyces brasiliensis]